jgi:hypothetical protein
LETRGYNGPKSAFADCERGIVPISNLDASEEKTSS